MNNNMKQTNPGSAAASDWRVTLGARAPRGTAIAPPSKSVSHRMLICAALADGVSELSGLAFSEDILATMDVLSALGARFDVADGEGAERTVRVQGCGGAIRPDGGALACRESGSTLRFVIPLCLLSDAPRTLRGSARLLSRPLQAYQSLFPERFGACTVTERDGGTLCLHGGNVLDGREYQLPGDVSSQFISGLLFALPLCRGEDSRIVLTTPPESRPYIDLTLDALHRFGVRASWENETTLYVPAGQSYRPYDGRVEGDASNAAFFDALNYFGGAVEVTGLRPDSLQGDRVFSALFAQIAAPRGASDPLPTFDLADCPDLAPILFTVAAERGGACFTHTDRLRIKECDRIAAMQRELAKFGARIEAIDGGQTPEATAVGGIVRVLPTKLHPPGELLCGHNDHRVVMSLAVAATKYGGTIGGAQAVKKSFPDFFERLGALGADVGREDASGGQGAV